MIEGPIYCINDDLSWSLYCLRFAPNVTTSFPEISTLPSFGEHSRFIQSAISKDLLFIKWKSFSNSTFANPFLAGVAWLYNITDHNAEFGRIVVHSSCRGLGYGNMLISHCIQYARNIGLSNLHLDVKSDNISAINLYKKVGFKQIPKSNTLGLITMSLCL